MCVCIMLLFTLHNHLSVHEMKFIVQSDQTHSSHKSQVNLHQKKVRAIGSSEAREKTRSD